MRHPAFLCRFTKAPHQGYPPKGFKFVYVITRSDTGLRYVGCTKESLEYRLYGHLRSTLWGEDPSLFSIELLETCPMDLAGERERAWIAKLDTCNPEKGWNKRPMSGVDHSHHVSVCLYGEDRAILEAVIQHQRLTHSDIIRRAVRAYAKELGVTPQPPQAA